MALDTARGLRRDQHLRRILADLKDLCSAWTGREREKICRNVPGASQGDDVSPFYLGYAYEAMARAELVAGNREQMEQYLGQAQRVADRVPGPEEKKWLLEDLAVTKARQVG